ncbi:isatin hydrolase-like [Montipora foliosa]|uniref:isatin hydrolase-like n=1 Tax=Montipora foliosa TaxID=591990 RepID=UPI0035F10C41
MNTLVVKLCLCAILCTPLFVDAMPAKSEWIELSYPFNNDTIYWPTVMSFHHTITFANFTEDGYYLSSYDISASEHGGTHIDSPSHFAFKKWTTDQIPLDTLIGPAVKIDVSSKAARSPDYQLMPSDLEAWEETHGRIPDDVILLVFNDWGKYWPDKRTFLGTDTKNTSLLHFPGIHPDASRWLVDNRKIKMVGIDTPSIDFGQSTLYESHRILYAENIPGLENVAHMDKLPVKGFTVYAAPMFISDGSGGPCRIFARLDDNGCTVNAGDKLNCFGFFWAVIVLIYLSFQ